MRGAAAPRIGISLACIDCSALMQVNFLIVESLKRYYYFYGDEFKVCLLRCVCKVVCESLKGRMERYASAHPLGLSRLPCRRARTT